MKEFFKAFGDSKIPTLLLVLLFLVVGAYIVVDSKGSVLVIGVGGTLVLIGVIFGIISFTDYRRKEDFEIIISHYKNALGSISKTHTVIEDSTRSSLTRKELGNKDEIYSILEREITRNT